MACVILSLSTISSAGGRASPEANYVVTTRTDAGAGSLRQALLDAGAGQVITFDASVFPPSNPATIYLLSPLPEISRGQIRIDASNAGVILDGRYAPAGVDGLKITSSQNTVQGLQIVNFPGDGIELTGGASHNLIGGDWRTGSALRGQGNIITANGDQGININGSGSTNNSVLGNLIGLDHNGTIDFRIHSLVLSPSFPQDKTVFVGTYQHGVWRSVDGGANWQQASSGLPAQEIRTLAASPNYAQDRTIFAGTARGGIYRSRNGGLSWSQVASELTNRDIGTIVLSPNFAQDGHVFAATNRDGVFFSSDSGDTWQARNLGLGDKLVRSISITPSYASDQTLFLATWTGVYKSTDRGLNWTKLVFPRSLGMNAVAVSPAYGSDRTVFVGRGVCESGETIFWFSNDAGATWQSATQDPVTCGLQRIVPDPAFTTSRTLFASDDWQGVFKSTDAGVTWTKILEGRFGWTLALSNGFAQDHTLFMGRKSGELLKSTNGGSSWTNTTVNLFERSNFNGGVTIFDSAKNNTIGGNTEGSRNIISHNSSEGVRMWGNGTSGNVVVGNYIGTDVSGASSLGNMAEGVVIKDGATANRVGGSSSAERNLISGNGGSGVGVWSDATAYNEITGNYIGVDVSGAAELRNYYTGVLFSINTHDNRLGGASAGEGNLISGNNDNGVGIWGGAHHNVVQGNQVGTDLSGQRAIANYDHGIVLGSGAQHNQIGGTSAIARNVVSGNMAHGIGVWEENTSFNVITGNYIGLNAGGDVALANGDSGIHISAGSTQTRVGGSVAEERNVIGGNTWMGIVLANTNTWGNQIVGNYLGVAADGVRAVPNKKGIACWLGSHDNTIERNIISGNHEVGIAMEGCTHNTLRYNQIGTVLNGSQALGHSEVGISLYNGAEGNIVGPGNIIAHNGEHGIGIWNATSVGNRITENSIHSNGVLGIETASGGNKDLTPPVITEVTVSRVTGITSLPSMTVEVFSDGNDQGRVFEGRVTSDGNGRFVFDKAGGFTGPKLTATGTDSEGNTTEFSAPVAYGDPTPTDTPTPTPTSTPTSTPTPTATPTNTPTPPSGASPDPFEPDNTCSSANALVPDGTGQSHTFHAAGDLDWVRFNAVANRRYVVTARAIGSLADLVLTPYRTCSDPTATPRYGLGRDVVLTWIAANDGPVFLRLENHNPAVFGAGTQYQISVREVSTGAAVIVGGRQTQPEELQSQITFMTNRAYQTFFQAGYDHGDIYYLSADPTPQPHVDGPSAVTNLQYALATWATGRVQDGDPLYVYLSDHGQPDLFFVNVDDVVTTSQLESWLLAFEQQRPNSPVVVIVEACKSGSLITPAQTLARPGRVIITSTGDGNDAYVVDANQGGGSFSDPFFTALGQNYSLWDSYQMAADAVNAAWGAQQTPWIEGDGDGLPYPADPDDQGAGRHLGLGRVPGLGGQAPYIEPPTLPTPAGSQPVTIRVQVLDESRATTTVWMEVTRPSTPPPSPPPGATTPVSHAERVNLVYNPAIDRFQVDFAFDEVGVYQLVFQAEDGSGQRAQPVVVTVRTGGRVYLPLIVR